MMEAAERPSRPTFGAVTVRPGDARYADLVTGVNQRWVAKPEYIRLVSTTRQVVDAVQEAVSAGKRIAIRGGGHCYEDFVSHDDAQVIIDMSEMSSIYYDRAHNAFAVEAGALLLDVYERLYKVWGLTIPAGFCYSVGVGGHISGGGFGLLSRQFGLTVDHLYAVEVVVVDRHGVARSVVATRKSTDPYHDLWWAHTGGGGGNFGVITRYWFRSPGSTGTNPRSLLPTPPAEVLLSVASLPWNRLDKAEFSRLVHNYGAWYERHSEPGARGTKLAGYLLLNHRANGNVGLLTQVDATAAGAESLLEEYLAELTTGIDIDLEPAVGNLGEHGPMPDLTPPRRLPWFRATQMLGTSSAVLNNPTLRSDQKSAYMRRNFPADQIATLYRYLTAPGYENPNAMVVLHPYGGMVNSVSPSATATPQRDSLFKVLYQSFWTHASEDDTHLAWMRDFYADMYAATGGVPVPGEHTDGCYVNYPDTDIGDAAYNKSDVPWYSLYYKDNYPRLQRVKARWDPLDIFRHAQSIRPPHPHFGGPSGGEDPAHL
jgi:FAD/FMN-containing dehydrogenase